LSGLPVTPCIKRRVMQSDTGTDFNFKIFADYMFAFLFKRSKYIVVYKEIVRSKRVFMYIVYSSQYRNDFFIAFFPNRIHNSACPITVLWFAGIISASLHDIILYLRCSRNRCFFFCIRLANRVKDNIFNHYFIKLKTRIVFM